MANTTAIATTPHRAPRLVGAALPMQLAQVEQKRPVARRVAGAVARAAMTEKHRLTAMAAAGALGFAERHQFPLPELPMVGKAGTYGLAAYVGAKMLKNETLSHVATGLLSVAVHDFAKGGGPAAAPSIKGDTTAGDTTEGDEIVGDF